MSELLHKEIRRTALQPNPWHIKNNWYGHKVYFTDNTSGEIYHCTEKNPEWLKEGKTLTHIVDNDKYPNKFPDKPYLVTPEAIEEDAKREGAEQERNEQKNESYSEQTTSYNRFQKRGNGNGGGAWKGFGRYEDSPDIWLKKQKFISILKFYEILIPLIAKGDIKYENLHEEVDKHLIHILEKSGMNILPPPPVRQTPPASSHSPVQKTSVKADKKNDGVVHSNRERQPDPEINPDSYSQEAPAELFAKENDSTNDSAPADILDKIEKCDTKSKLTILQRTLTPVQLKNEKIMEAFFKRKNELTKKK